MRYMYDDEDLYLWDFDGYNNKELGMTYKEVFNCEFKKAGHAFILAAMLEDQIKDILI